MKKLIIAALALLPAVLFAANTITVTNTNDSGLGSLRQAIDNQAANGDTIRFALSTYPDTIKLTSGQITLDINLTIIGLGDDSTIISGDNSSRIFNITAADTIRLERLSLLHGMAADSGGAVYNNGSLSLQYCNVKENAAVHGGAILSKSSLFISRSLIQGNTASASAGAILVTAGTLGGNNSTFSLNSATGNGGAVVTHGSTTFSNFTFGNNYTDASGGALYATNALTVSNCIFNTNEAVVNGGALVGSGNFKITSCTFNDNASIAGGAIYSSNVLLLTSSTIRENFAETGGGIWTTGSATVVNSSIYDNEAEDGNGGGILSLNDLYISTSTISHNIATDNGGGIAGTVIDIERSTITNNNAEGNGGGIFTADSLRFSNTIVGGNTCAGSGPDIYRSHGVAVSLGHNLVSDNSQSGFTPTTGDIVGTSAIPVNVFLAPLANNGGTTLTHLPLCNSPAIDAADSTGASPLDQAGKPRVHGEAMDIGSVELQTDAVKVEAVITHETTSGAGNGAIQAVVSGGTIPYSYEWSTGSNQLAITGLNAGNYALTVTDFNGCGDSAVFVVNLIDGIFEVPAQTVAVYPNPVQEFFTVDYPFTNCQLEVIDMSGKVLRLTPVSAGATSAQFIVKGFPAGNYRIKITDGKKVVTGSLLKE